VNQQLLSSAASAHNDCSIHCESSLLACMLFNFSPWRQRVFVLSRQSDQTGCQRANERITRGILLMEPRYYSPRSKADKRWKINPRGIAFLLFEGEAAGCPFTPTIQPTAVAAFSLLHVRNNNNKAHIIPNNKIRGHSLCL
jgi:hypothetical protein